MRIMMDISMFIRIAICIMLCFSNSFQLSGQTAQDAATAGRLDAYLRAHARAGTFMGTVLVARGDRILLCRGYGSSDLERGELNDARTRFRLGSVTKGFTAAAVLQLQERGLLSIDDPISKYVPGRFTGEGITVRHLLTHTSGLPDFIFFPDAFNEFARPAALDDIIAAIDAEALEFEPGSKFRYSNSGYAVLTKVIETASGETYAEYVEKNLFRAAGMSASGCGYEAGFGTDGFATGYHFTGESYVPVPSWDSSWAAGAGTVYASAADLYAWSRALSRGRILGAASLDLLFGPTEQSRSAYGMGWYLRANQGKRRTYHGGYIFGFRSDFTRYPDEEIDIIVLSNVDQAPTRRIAEDLAAILFGTPYELPVPRVPAARDTSAYKTYEGVYDTSEIFGEGADMRVQTDGSRLWYQSNTVYDSLGLPIYIYPDSSGGFFDKTGDVLYEFLPGKGGYAEALVASDPYEGYRFPRTGP